ncbi:MAG: T9SS type A sorting domain-containing protein [Bacteroidia bacterium]|nr:T9SS type A sorting domain-containing protein [Bacteroidia bacterium]
MKQLISFLAFLIPGTTMITAQPCMPNTSSLVFDGLSSYVSFSTENGLNPTDAITVEAWIKADAWGQFYWENSIVCNSGWSLGEEGYVLRAGGTGELSFAIAGMDTSGTPVSWVDVISGDSALTLNTWTHVAGTFDGNQLAIFIDGNLAGTVPFPGTIVPSVDYLFKIGKLADDNQPEDRFFSGMIDEVRIYNRALSQAEIQSGMNHQIDTASAAGLVGYWRMNEDTGTAVGDLGLGMNTGLALNTNWTDTVPFSDTLPVPIITWNGNELVSTPGMQYQWFFNGDSVPGEIFQTYIPLLNGLYTVSVADSNGCISASLPYIFTTAGLNENSGNGRLMLWPVPSGQRVYINGTGNMQHQELTVINSMGMVVFKANVSGLEVSGENRVLNVSGWARGVYLVQVSGSSELKTTRLVVQ